MLWKSHFSFDKLIVFCKTDLHSGKRFVFDPSEKVAKGFCVTRDGPKICRVTSD